MDVGVGSQLIPPFRSRMIVCEQNVNTGEIHLASAHKVSIWWFPTLTSSIQFCLGHQASFSLYDIFPFQSPAHTVTQPAVYFCTGIKKIRYLEKVLTL